VLVAFGENKAVHNERADVGSGNKLDLDPASRRTRFPVRLERGNEWLGTDDADVVGGVDEKDPGSNHVRFVGTARRKYALQRARRVVASQQLHPHAMARLHHRGALLRGGRDHARPRRRANLSRRADAKVRVRFLHEYQLFYERVLELWVRGLHMHEGRRVGLILVKIEGGSALHVWHHVDRGSMVRDEYVGFNVRGHEHGAQGAVYVFQVPRHHVVRVFESWYEDDAQHDGRVRAVRLQIHPYGA
jgi:hypothetical protein